MTLLAHAVDACPATADTGDATSTATTTAKAVYQLLNAGPAQGAANTWPAHGSINACWKRASYATICPSIWTI
jgi:hypothetical protein